MIGKILRGLMGLFRRREDKPPLACVWLLSEPRQLDQATVVRMVEQELSVKLTRTDDPDAGDSTRFVVGEAPSMMLKFDEFMFLVNCFPTPYFDKPERMAKQIPELRMRNAVAEHRAWMSVDLLGEYPPEVEARGVEIIARLAARFADDRCLALVLPHLSKIFAFENGLLEQLRSPDPMSALTSSAPPVVLVRDDDPAMLAAVAEARRRWPEFVEAFRRRDVGSGEFSVKLKMTEGENTEHLWITVVGIDGDEIMGDVANNPVTLRFIREGSRVRGRLENLSDWMWTRESDYVGGFTAEVLMKAHGAR